MARQTSQRVYIVVRVWRGMAAGATTFRTLAAAQRFFGQLRGKSNPLEEDIRIFQGTV
jgi:hypothetical protein